MATEQIKAVQEMLNADEHQDLRTSIYAAFLEDEQRGANMIVAFAAERDITLAVDDVVTALNALDDEEIDIEMTPEMLSNVAGAGKCECQEEAHDEPWGRCPGMRPMRKWLFGATMTSVPQ